MAALVAATHDLVAAWVIMGGRDKPGQDGLELIPMNSKPL